MNTMTAITDQPSALKPRFKFSTPIDGPIMFTAIGSLLNLASSEPAARTRSK